MPYLNVLFYTFYDASVLLPLPRKLCNARLCVCVLFCLSVSLSLCNSTLKTAERFFVRILPQMYLWTRKKQLNLGSHLPADPDPEIFLKDSSTLRDMAFFHYGVCLWRELTEFRENFIALVSSNKKSPLNFVSNPDPEAGSGYRLRIQTLIRVGGGMHSPSALVE